VKRLISLATIVFAVLLTAAAAGAGNRTESDGGTTTPSIDTGSALVVLKGDPLATSERTKPTHGKKIDFGSTAVKNYRSQLNALRNDFKAWLRANAPSAQVTGEFDISLNAVGVKLNGTTLGTLVAAPMVASAQHQAVYRPLAHEDPDLSLVHALEAWNAGGGSSAAKGDGVKVAIVDSGIDVTHPCFSDVGYPNQAKEGPAALTNNKVIVAKVFNNKAANKGWTPEDLNSHGTHVAGTVACNEHTDAVVDGVSVTYDPSGVAPRALLGNYNVFPGDDGDARSEDIVDALDEAYEDGFDIANMSLGGASSGNNDLLAMATDNLDLANMVVAVAAGNSGPGFSTIESPGKAARALTAGASTVGHFIAAPVTSGSLNVPAVAGDFPTVSADLTLPLGVVTGTGTPSGLSTACNTNKPAAGSLTDKIALISRGTCTFSEKIRNAQDAGADAVLVVNNVGGDATAMGLGGIPNEPTVPAYMVSLSDGNLLKANNGVSTTISATKSYFQTPNSNLMAGFSSMGPTDVDFRVKPDVVAPGVNVLSSQPSWTCKTAPCWAFFQGTSMATPHLAGIAAVVRGQHRTWSAAQVRSAIVNTADQGVLKNTSGSALATDVNTIGSGRANAWSATLAKVALDPVSLSFGSVASGSGQSLSGSITLSNLLGSGPYTATITDQTGGNVTFVPAVSGNTITVTMTVAKRASAGSRQGVLRVWSGGTEVAHAAVYAFVK
jgi:minor extracellular serine protease Vpr